ncbi:MAG TPA: HAD family hydrolase [Candidatus Dormibacteraeota bacterium]
MRYLALATDYDGTLAHDGQVDEETVAALRRLVPAGCKLILVTGRQLGDLYRVFPQFALFDRIIAENGAVVANPSTGEVRTIADPPPPQLVSALESRGVRPLYRGQVVLATVEPSGRLARDAIADLGLDFKVILNKGSVMILPTGVDKASGLRVALEELAIPAKQTLAIGDAENDQALLEMAGCAVAVANALDEIKQAADLVTRADHGAGVRELIDRLLDAG